MRSVANSRETQLENWLVNTAEHLAANRVGYFPRELVETKIRAWIKLCARKFSI